MPKTLLLADDSVTIQKVVGISFANEDIVLLTVDNGDDAIAKAREARPDLVLADVVMPGKNGYEVCEAIKAEADLQNVPVLLLTGTFEAFDEDRATRAGADGHITKPFEAQALVDRVNGLLARAAATAPAPAPAAPAEATPAEVTAEPAAGYDFFDEEATEPGAAPALPVRPASDPPAAASENDLGLGESGGQSFRFDTAPDLGEDLEVPAEPDLPPGGGDETVILPAGSSLLAEPDPGVTPPPFAESRGSDPEPTSDPVFDALDDVSTVPGAAGTATPNPDAGHDYDVSSTDLGDPLPAAPSAAASPDETVIMGEPLVAAEPVAAEPVFAAEPPPIPQAPQPAAEPVAPPPLPEPPAAAFAASEPPASEQPPAWEEPAAPASAEPAPGVEITPAMREEIRSALEKVAWEAFGSVAESLVKDAIERIEKVAWEVVPQLAETLVQEEIRRMKGE